MRPSTFPAAALLGVLLCGASLVSPSPISAAPLPPSPGDETAEAVRRFKDGWNSGLDNLKPEEIEGKRAPLLEPLVASGSIAALDAVLAVARERAFQVAAFKERLKKLDERDKEREADEKAGKKPEAPPDAAAAGARFDAEQQAKKDREEFPGRIAREAAWQPRLAAAAGALLDALADPEFQKSAAPRLAESLGDRCEGWDDWMVDALGRSRKERTAALLLGAAEEALKEYRKGLAARVGPARDLDKANQEINDRLLKYLEQRQKQGDFSNTYPSNLIPEGLTNDRTRLDTLVNQLTSSMDAADIRRRTSRRSVGGMLAGAPEDARGRLLDLLEKQALGQKDFESRIFGLGAVGPCPGDRAMKFLREAAKDPSPEVVVAALDALGPRPEAECIEILGAALADPRWQVRATAAAGLGTSGRAAAVPPLLAALGKAEGRTVDDLVEALVRLTGKKLPGAAGAWEEWWKSAGATFRGPKDPSGGGPAAGGPAAGGDAPAGGPAPGPSTDAAGNRVSFYGIETRSDRMLFVLDFSGSMTFGGSDTDKNRKKIDILYEEIKRTISGLPDGAKFNLVGFSNDVRVWKKGGAVRDGKTAKEAVEWIEKQKVIGSTNIYDALETSFRMMGVGASADKAYAPAYDTIFFMTDGVPTSGKVTDKTIILGEVRRWNEGRKIRVHVVGMGGKQKGGPPGPGGADDVDKDFLTKLAEQNGGQVVFR